MGKPGLGRTILNSNLPVGSRADNLDPSQSGWPPNLQSVRRINCSTVSARMPNIGRRITLPGPRTLTWRPPNSSLSPPLTPATVERSR